MVLKLTFLNINKKVTKNPSFLMIFQDSTVKFNLKWRVYSWLTWSNSSYTEGGGGVIIRVE